MKILQTEVGAWYRCVMTCMMPTFKAMEEKPCFEDKWGYRWSPHVKKKKQTLKLTAFPQDRTPPKAGPGCPLPALAQAPPAPSRWAPQQEQKAATGKALGSSTVREVAANSLFSCKRAKEGAVTVSYMISLQIKDLVNNLLTFREALISSLC